jgi:RNA polymerase sigma-70 factor, ECF subfamily
MTVAARRVPSPARGAAPRAPSARAPLLGSNAGAAPGHIARSVSMAAQPSHPHGGDAGDGALLERLRRGDRAAFASLVDRHAGSLLRVAGALLRDPAAAEEVVQETWVALLTGLAGFEGRASLRTWLFRVLVFKARTRFHRDGRLVPFSALVRDEDRPAAVDADELAADRGQAPLTGGWTDTDPEQLALAAETREAIEAAIQALPDAQRAVLTLRDVEGLETDEICRLLGVTTTNQRVLLHRARLRVREALARRLGRRP